MPDDTEIAIEALRSIMDNVTGILGVDESKHGMQQGTFQMSVIEAQGGSIVKGPALGSSLQSTAELGRRMYPTAESARDGIRFTRAQVSGTYDHYDQMRNAANRLVTLSTQAERQFATVQRLSPDAARVSRQAYQPILGTAAERVRLVNQIEEFVVQITRTGNANRLSSIQITETGRQAENLAFTQLESRGVAPGFSTSARNDSADTPFAGKRRTGQRAATRPCCEGGSSRRCCTSGSERGWSRICAGSTQRSRRFSGWTWLTDNVVSTNLEKRHSERVQTP
jgi:hypothetical protein